MLAHSFIEEAWNSPKKIMERALQIAQRKAIESERRIFALTEENETLEIALNTSLKFYTVAKYNRTFNIGWNLKQCQRIGKRLSAYCRSRAIEIRTCETNDERFGSNSNTNVAMLGQSFKYVAPLFGALGYSAEDAALALGLMANAGNKSSQAGTSLKTAIANLANPTGNMAKAMNDLGISITDANGEMLPFKGVMDELRTKFANLSEEQQAQYAATIFGKEAMAGMLAIINASDEDYAKLTEATRNYTGRCDDR